MLNDPCVCVLQVVVFSDNTAAGGAAAGHGAAARRGQLQVAKQVVITNRAAYVTQEIYGHRSGGGDGGAGEDSEECVICLSEPKVCCRVQVLSKGARH